jgi:hypothetical protein
MMAKPSRLCQLLQHTVHVVSLFVYLVLLGSGCSGLSMSRPVPVDTLSIRDLYPGALQIAKAWKEDAYLVQAQTSFWPRDSNAFRSASFSFRSSSTDVIGLSVRYDPESASFTEEWLSVFKEDSRYKAEIADAEWHLDSVEALEISQQAGGAEFLEARRDLDYRTLYVRLEKHPVGQDLRTVWFVAYYAGMPSGADLRIVIDAVTGEVLEVDGEVK